MKKILFCTSALVLLIHSLKGQNLQAVTDTGNSTSNLVRVEGVNNIPGTGAGLELYYTNGQGYIQSRNRTGNVNTVLNLAGSLINTTSRTLINFAQDDGSTALQVNGGIKTNGASYRAFTANTTYGYATIDLTDNNNRRVFMGYNAAPTTNSYATFGVVDDNGVERGLYMQRASGYVGIGTTTPQRPLDVAGPIRISSDNNAVIDFSNSTDNQIWFNKADTSLNFKAGGVERFVVLGNGNVGVGTLHPQSKLAVAGIITAQRVRVTLSDWSDFVFHEDYQLPTLQDIEKYVIEHKHLPDIPSAEEVKKDGIELGEMNKKLLQKIEELTLHLIRQQKEIDSLKEWKKGVEGK